MYGIGYTIVYTFKMLLLLATLAWFIIFTVMVISKLDKIIKLLEKK